MFGGTGDDVMNILETGGEETESLHFTGVVDYYGDAGSGDDTWIANVNFHPDSNGAFQSLTVLLGEGDDTLILSFLQLGRTVALNDRYDGGPGEDSYFGPPPGLLVGPPPDLPALVEGFENIVISG
jgi:hypothetical protein